MPTLHLGVLDVPYQHTAAARRRGAKAPSMSTGDVAEILEANYGVMGAFYSQNQARIGVALATGLAGALENLLMGAPPLADPFLGAGDKIKEMFSTFLTAGSPTQAEQVIPGAPTQAALRGVSHRFKRPYARRARRPSFVDTGLYENSFRAWVD